MSKLAFSGHIKIPRAQGVATVQKLRLVDGGNPDNPEDWEEDGEAQKAPNLVLDQAMAMYACWMDLGANNDPSYSDPGRMSLTNEGWNYGLFGRLYVSDNSDAPDPTTTTKAGTVHIVAHAQSVITEDVGDYFSNGIHYTKTTREGIFYSPSGISAGYTINKLYGATISAMPAYLNPRLDANAPISELLLPSPVTITDPDKEAVKFSYSIYWPRMGDVNTFDQGVISCGSGSIVLQERDLEDNVTNGPTIGWTMKYAGHRTGDVAGPDEETEAHKLYGRLSVLPIQTDQSGGDVGVIRYTQAVGTALTQIWPRDQAVAVISYPTAKSMSIDFQQILSRVGSVGNSRDIASIMFLWSDDTSSWGQSDTGGSPWWVEFDQAITVDWTQTLEIHASLTIDWS